MNVKQKSKKKAKQYAKFDEAVTPSTRSLLQLSPENPTFRAHLLNEIKQAPPEEAKTYEDLVKWVEGNIEKKYNFDPDAPFMNLRVPLSRKTHGSCHFTDVTYYNCPHVMTNLDVWEVVQAIKADPDCRSMDRYTLWNRLRNDLSNVITKKITEAIDEYTEEGTDDFLDSVCSYERVEEETSDKEEGDRGDVEFGSVRGLIDSFSVSVKHAMAIVDPSMFRRLS